MAPNTSSAMGKVNEAFNPEDEPVDDVTTSSISSFEGDTKKKKKKSKKKGGDDDDGPPALTPVTFFALFRYASGSDKFLVVLGIIAAAGTGVMFPLMTILFGDLTNAFVNGGLSEEAIYNISCYNLTGTDIPTPEPDNDAIREEFTRFGVYVAIIGGVLFFLGLTFVTSLNFTAENQVYRLRSKFLQAVLRQDVGWYDTKASNDFASRITEDLNKIQDGIGEKIGMFTFSMSSFLASMVNAFVHGWELTLVMMVSFPVLAIAMGFLAKIQASLTERELKAYAKAGGVAEEVFSSIRTVMAFGGQKREIDRFENSLVIAKGAGIKRGLATGVGAGLVFTIIYASYSLAFWYGISLILNVCESQEYSPSDLLIVFFSVLVGAMQIGQAAPYMEAFSVARGAGATIFDIIDRVPPIDSSSTEGKVPAGVEGKISFEKIRFNYPSRANVKVLQGLTFDIQPGQTVALVGASGCGKSTCIQLLQRFYDPLEGSVSVDGNDIRQLNLAWLRSQIGVVGQEPILFGTTIGENIRYGRDGVTQEEVERAAKEANAYDFIQRLPKKFETMVGERGAQLSGGQKQRIAIARALVRNPKILLLDEATSALDTQSEAAVQKALDQARLGRTTIIVAQRLSAIRNADRILVLENGVIVEQGTQKELIAKQGVFFKLVKSQQENSSTESKLSEQDLTDLNNLNRTDLKSVHRGLDIMNDSKLTSAAQTIEESTSLLEVLPKHELGSDCSLQFRREKLILKQILQSNRDNWPLIATGVAAAVIVGLCPPTYAYLYSEVIGSLTPEFNKEKLQRGNFFAMMFLVLGLVGGAACFVRSLSFSLASESLTQRLRVQAFNSIIEQEAAWFDRPSNSVGVLCSRLSDDAATVQGATGSRLGILFQTMTTITVAVVVSLVNDWRLGLTATAFVPLLFLTAYYQAKQSKTQSVHDRSSRLDSARIATEAIANIRTVASLGLEQFFHKLYVESFAYSSRAALRRALIRGVVYGSTKAVSMLSYAVTIYYGGWLVSNDSLPFVSVFKITESLLYGTQAAGQALAMAPDYQKAKLAARNIYALIKRTAKIDVSSQDGKQLKEDQTKGTIEFQNVHFNYGKNSEVLRGVDFAAMPNQSVAIVGPSGSGKSSAAQLVLRFYDYQYGAIRLDEQVLTDLSVGSLRSNVAIVSQEPVLFNTTLRENIEYGDNGRHVPMDEVIEAARKANIHTFIQSLPNGYETMVGERGTQLSGGQKQRVAIARALVRNPKILLLDEATSALDSESEKVVQMALDAAREGRTCITIAHRLSTIQNADKIFVLNNGKVQEQGKHEELLKIGGLYYELCTVQGISHE